MLIAASCAPTYDERLDRAISDLQHQVDSKIVTLVGIDRRISAVRSRGASSDPGALSKLMTGASFASNAGFYDEVDTNLTSAQLRLDSSPGLSTPKIDSTFEQLRNILVGATPPGNQPTSMAGIHAAQNRLGEPYLLSTRSQVNTLFATLMQYETTIKAGKSPAK